MPWGSWACAASQHLPGVGANLQDHLSIPLTHRRIGEESPLASYVAAGSPAAGPGQRLFRREGPRHRPAERHQSILRSSPHLDAPDIQIIFGAGALEARPWLPGFNDWQDVFDLRPVGSHPGEPRPRCRWLRRTRATSRALIHVTFRIRTTCASCATASASCAKSCGGTPLDAFRGEELSPGRGCTSDADIDAHIRKTATTVQHASCTCRIGRDESAVVDPQLRVRGVERLRVVDASVMPEILSCNIHAAVLAIAEWASDVIRGHAPLRAETAGQPASAQG